MNKLRMSVALIITGMLVMACGRGFAPMKEQVSSVGTTIPDTETGTPLTLVTPPGQTAVTSPLDVSLNSTNEQTSVLWPQVVGDDPAQTLAENKQIANVIKGLKVIFKKTEDPLVSAETRDVYTFIARGCDTPSGVLTDLLSSRINFGYLSHSPTKVINIGDDANYKLKLSCTDNKCTNATLFITANVKTNISNNGAINSAKKTLSAAVYMSTVPGTGTLVPTFNTALANDSRYITLGQYDAIKEACPAASSIDLTKLPEFTFPVQ